MGVWRLSAIHSYTALGSTVDNNHIMQMVSVGEKPDGWQHAAVVGSGNRGSSLPAPVVWAGRWGDGCSGTHRDTPVPGATGHTRYPRALWATAKPPSHLGNEFLRLICTHYHFFCCVSVAALWLCNAYYKNKIMVTDNMLRSFYKHITKERISIGLLPKKSIVFKVSQSTS